MSIDFFFFSASSSPFTARFVSSFAATCAWCKCFFFCVLCAISIAILQFRSQSLSTGLVCTCVCQEREREHVYVWRNNRIRIGIEKRMAAAIPIVCFVWCVCVFCAVCFRCEGKFGHLCAHLSISVWWGSYPFDSTSSNVATENLKCKIIAA